MARIVISAPSLETFDRADEDGRNRLLLGWLSDDEHRARLYALINERLDGRLEFPSRDSAPREPQGLEFDAHRESPPPGHKSVVLVTRRADIEAALRDKGEAYSNRIYAELGGGSFMLALDPAAAPAHAMQREAFFASFPHGPKAIDLLTQLSHQACRAASIMALRLPEFDLAAFAEQSALRFCQKLLGYSMSDYRLLETSLRAAYRALVHQVLGRHFVTDPVALPAARSEMARLLARTSELIDAYATDDEDALAGCEDRAVPSALEPALKALGKLRGELNGEQRAIIAAGAAIGTVGNVQAAVCIALKALFSSIRPQAYDARPVNDTPWHQARDLARSDPACRPTECFDKWWALVHDALRANPPIPFLPRWRVADKGRAGQEWILALGGAVHGHGDDALIWGLPEEGRHWCAGMGLARPLIVEIVRQVMALPGLDQRLDPQDASVIGLKKRWGFACESYPLTHRRDRRVAQSSLNVAMRLRPPVKDSADRVREVIRSGAPRIEEALREARHVHFAWFELIESDCVLVLHTVYDGPFAAYIQHFALKVGVLFDALFAHIEDPPPMPVDKFPNEFVAHILRYDRPPTMGYFFSAYPRSEVAQIVRDDLARP